MKQRCSTLFAPSLALTNQFFDHIIQGNQLQAEVLLEKNPNLLLTTATVKENSGQEFTKTAFQLALLRHDIEMVEMLERAFEQLDRGQEIKAAQFYELFPDGLPKEHAPSFDFSFLIDAVSLSPSSDNNVYYPNPSSPIQKKLSLFRESFSAVATSELFFNPNHLSEALRIYSAYYPHWRPDQRNLFWCCVIGFVERFSPTWLLQGFAAELGSTLQFMKRGVVTWRPSVKEYFEELLSNPGILGETRALHCGGASDYCNSFYIETLQQAYTVICDLRKTSLREIENRILTNAPAPAPRLEDSYCTIL